ncbi:MAG: hypothetical protein MNPFHGCM_02212 [Gemmatimonadaceae bacterium]|nr:hypothetical protein [Gemmatimonadaceae bacterium]
MYYSDMNSSVTEADRIAGEGHRESVVISLIEVARSVEDQIEHSLSEHGLSWAKLGVLSRLVEAGEPLTLGEIAAKLQCVRSNVTQLIDRLESDGLVRRVDDPSDRRSIRAELTEKGRERHHVGAEAMNEVQARLLSNLGGAAEQVALGHLLQKLG